MNIKILWLLFKKTHAEKTRILLFIEALVLLIFFLAYFSASASTNNLLLFFTENYSFFLYGYAIYIGIIVLKVFFIRYLRLINNILDNDRLVNSIFILIFSGVIFNYIHDKKLLTLEELKELNSINWMIISLLMALVLIVYFTMLSHLKEKKSYTENPYYFNSEVKTGFSHSWLICLNFFLLNAVTLNIYIAQNYSIYTSYMSMISMIITLNILFEAVITFYKLIKEQKNSILFEDIIRNRDKDDFFNEHDKYMLLLIKHDDFNKTHKSFNKEHNEITSLNTKFEKLNEKLNESITYVIENREKVSKSDVKKVIKDYKKLLELKEEIDKRVDDLIQIHEKLLNQSNEMNEIVG